MTVERRADGLEWAQAQPPGHQAGGEQPEGGARAADPDAECWCCGGATAKRHCKVVCTNCGFMRDCSDQ